MAGDSEYNLKLAWAAGFLDGDGCFSLLSHKQSDKTFRAVCISSLQISKKPLEELENIFGGNITLSKKARGNKKEVYQWRLGDAKVVKSAINKLLPFLLFKKKEAIILLKWCEFPNCRHRTYTEQERSEREILIKELEWCRKSV